MCFWYLCREIGGADTALITYYYRKSNRRGGKNHEKTAQPLRTALFVYAVCFYFARYSSRLPLPPVERKE